MYNLYIMQAHRNTSSTAPATAGLARTQVYLTQTQQKRLALVARGASVTKSELIRRAVEQFLNQQPAASLAARLSVARSLALNIVLPAAIPSADLLVSLHESAGAAELIPDIARRCGAAAVLAAVDDRAACPRGLENQIGKRLGAMGVAFAFARPLCGFDGGPHPLLSAFAERFGFHFIALS